MTVSVATTIENQAHTCKTLGIVTKPKSIASTHAQMRPRNIIHARAQLPSYSRSHPAPKALGVVASSKVLGKSYLSCTSREAPRFLALGQQVFDNSSLLIRFRCLGVRSKLPLYTKTICWCSLPPQRWPRIAVKGIYRHNFRPVHF